MDSLRIASLNCLNLALPGLQLYEGMAAFSADEYVGRTQWLAGLLDRLAADVVLLQEVFHERALVDVVRQTARQGGGMSCAVPFADENNRRPRLGIIWRTPLALRIDSIVTLPCAPVPIAELDPHREFSRPVLRATLDITLASGTVVPLTLLNVHLKSRRPEFSAQEDRDDGKALARAQLRALTMRAAEACGVRHVVLDTLKTTDGPLLVAGDFNDELNAVTTRIVADSSWRSDAEGQGQFTLHEAASQLPRRHWSAAREAFSILHGTEPERIDHIFVSHALSTDNPAAMGHVAAVEWLVDHLIERQRASINGPVNVGGSDLTRIYSDHAAVCATIMFGR